MIFDFFRKLTSGTVIDKHDYGALEATSDRIVGTGKNAILVPATLGSDERYTLTVRGTVRPGGKEYVREIYVWGSTWGAVSIGQPFDPKWYQG
jgi:hypothetical protein